MRKTLVLLVCIGMYPYVSRMYPCVSRMYPCVSRTFKCARSRCKTCLFIVNTSKISGPKRSVKITDRFTCTSANVIYCITCRLCNKLYIGETGRRLGDRFREHLRDVEKNDKLHVSFKGCWR